MSTPSIGPGSDDPFEKMRIRPAPRPDREDEDGGQGLYGSPAATPPQTFPPQPQGFAQAPAPNPYAQQGFPPPSQAPSPYAPQAPAPNPYASPNPYAPQGFAPQAPSPYGQQAPDLYAAGSPEGSGAIALDTGFFWLALVLFLTGPSASVDGVELVRKWGKQLLPVAPGQHLVEIHTRYLWPMGRASLPVFVQPGQTVPVFYQAPTIAWLKGAIGHAPQKAPGLVLTVVLLAVVMLLACVIPVVSLLIAAQ
ncbi:MAG: hypothetical protein ACRC20_14095 [Segniliparus sp.]|uniref:hypothetical protein n=1 Tax=Segniliparus sp. TaxID=2804064 RepID=UPI003F3EF5C5